MLLRQGGIDPAVLAGTRVAIGATVRPVCGLARGATTAYSVTLRYARRFAAGRCCRTSHEVHCSSATERLAAPLRVGGRRSAARCDLSPPVELDLHQLVRGAGHTARVAADRCGAAARDTDADGPADGDGGGAVRAVLAALGRLPRPRAQAARLHRGRGAAGAVRRQRAAGLVDRVVVDDVALPYRIRARNGVHDRRQRGADRAHPDRSARKAGRGAREERAGEFVGRSGRTGPGRRADQAGRCAVCLAGRCGAAAGFCADPARYPRYGGSAARCDRFLAGAARRNALRGRASAAGDDGADRGRMADVPPIGAGRADSVCHPHAGPVARAESVCRTSRWARAPSSRAPWAIAFHGATDRVRRWCSDS